MQHISVTAITPEEIKRAMIGIDYKKIADRNGKTIEEVTPVVDEFYNQLKEYFPDEDNDFYKTVLYNEIDKKFYTPAEKKSSLDYAKDKASKFDVVLFSVSNVFDANGGKKQAVRRRYRKFANKTLSNGESNPDYSPAKAKEMIDNGEIAVVKNADGSETWHVLDNQKTFGKDGNENPKYGQPLAYIKEREFYGIDLKDGNFYKLHGNVGVDLYTKNDDGSSTLEKASSYPDIGVKCAVWGSKTLNQPDKLYPYDGVIKVWKDGYEDASISDDKSYTESVPQLWDMLVSFHEQFFINKYDGVDENGSKKYSIKTSVSIPDVIEMPSFGLFVTRGFVGDIIPPSDGSNSTKIIIKNEVGDRIKLSTSYENLVSKIDNLAVGDEVIVIGERKSFKSQDGYKPYNALYGIHKNPVQTSSISETMKKYQQFMASNTTV